MTLRRLAIAIAFVLTAGTSFAVAGRDECAGQGDGTPCIDDGNECTDDICASEACTHPYHPLGTLCTDDGNDCRADICSGDGVCIHPVEPAGTPCGNPDNTQCDNPDTCDGFGTCLPNTEPLHTTSDPRTYAPPTLTGSTNP